MSRPATRPRARKRDIVIVGLLVAGLLGGLVLVFLGGGDADRGGTGNPSIDGTSSRPTLPTEDLSTEAVSEWSGLELPNGAADFLTARVGGEQLDLTFTIPTSEVDEFLTASGLPEPEPGRRVVLHSSPLWELNPGSGDGSPSSSAPSSSTETSTTTAAQPAISGAVDTHAGLRRAVELYEEQPGLTRTRIVLTPI